MILVVVLFCCRFTNCHAQDTGKDVSTYLMEEIVVTDSIRTTASEIRIGSERIRTERSNTASDILAGVPGALVTAGHKNSSEIIIRGFDSSSTLVMVDGRPVNGPYYGKSDLSTIGLGDITNIRIVKGASSVRFGPNAMGGAINILTDDGSGAPAEVRLSAGSRKDIRTDITQRGRVKNIGYNIHFGRRTTDGFPLSSDFENTALEDGDNRNNSDYRRTDLSAKLLFGSLDHPRWSLKAGGSHLVKGLPSSIREARYWRFRKWDRISIDIDGEPVITGSFRLKTKLYADRFFNELVDYRDEHYDLSDVFWISTHDNRNAGLLLSSSYMPGENGTTNFGLQARWDESRRQADRGMRWHINRTATTWLFTEHERFILPNLYIRGGLSGILFSYDNWNTSAAEINPSLHIEWTVRDNTISASASRVNRFPTLHHLFSDSSGNPNLDPESAFKTEVSVSRPILTHTQLSVTAFMNRVRDMIYRSGRLGIYHNIEKASLDGIEIESNFSSSVIDLSASVTALDARDSRGVRLEYRPQWKTDIYVSYRLSRNIRVYGSGRALGRRKTETGSHLDSYHTGNAGLIIACGHNINASLHFRNVLDSDYEEEYGYPMPGRTLMAGLDWQWEKKTE